MRNLVSCFRLRSLPRSILPRLPDASGRCILGVFLLAIPLLGVGTAEAGLWQDYGDLYTRRAEEMKELGLWGGTALPPAGMWSLQEKHIRYSCDSKFDEHGNRGPVLKPLDILGGSLDLAPRATLSGHIVSFLCGLGKGWAFALQAEFGNLDVEFDVDYRAPASPEARLTADVLHFLYGTERFTESMEGLWQTFELLGHPRLTLQSEDGGLKMGDFSAILGCNYWRSSTVSLLGAVRLSFPTSRLAEANKSLTFALGPDKDTGTGSYGFEFAHLSDFRLSKSLGWLVFSTELYYSFYLEHQRESPTVFTKPNQGVIALLDLAGVHVGPYFPDLSGMEAEYGFRPGSRAKGVFQIVPTFLGILTVTAGVEMYYNQAAAITTSTPEFRQYIDAVGLLKESWVFKALSRVAVGLYPLKIPVTLAAGFYFPVAGKNFLVLNDNWEFVFQFSSPWVFGNEIPFVDF